jgi:hypothetical protein
MAGKEHKIRNQPFSRKRRHSQQAELYHIFWIRERKRMTEYNYLLR